MNNLQSSNVLRMKRRLDLHLLITSEVKWRFARAMTCFIHTTFLFRSSCSDETPSPWHLWKEKEKLLSISYVSIWNFHSKTWWYRTDQSSLKALKKTIFRWKFNRMIWLTLSSRLKIKSKDRHLLLFQDFASFSGS